MENEIDKILQLIDEISNPELMLTDEELQEVLERATSHLTEDQAQELLEKILKKNPGGIGIN